MAASLALVGRRSAWVLAWPFVAIPFTVFVLLVLATGLADAQDVQKARLGNGVLTIADCIRAGANGILDSVATPDDDISGTRIRAGANGICDSTLNGTSDDVLEVPTGQGEPNQGVIRSGSEGICDDVIVPGGDDVVVIPAGQGRPLMVAVKTGIDDVLDAAAAGDDITTGVICATADNTLETSVNPADVSISRFDPLCTTLCQDNSNCIIPGPDGMLQSAVAPTDHLEPFISTGFDGVAQSTAIDDDEQITPVGNGFIALGNGGGVRGEICVDSGTNGIVETTICGNSIRDTIESPTTLGVNECDDGGAIVGDGCDATCGVETGWSCTGEPSICTPICADGEIVGGEPCDDGNGSNADACLNVAGTCTSAICGDGVRKTGGPGANELCDDGNLVNGDGCDNNCTPSGCGNGVLNGGEVCDDGNVVSGDGCDANCTPTACGNGVRTGAEQCDDGNASNLDACLDTCISNICGDGFPLAGTEACDDGNAVDGDGCDVNCTVTGCGNAIVTAGEACDDGNPSNTDACLTTCVAATCGDGFGRTTPPAEQCDDGNLVSGDGCDGNCTTTRCGNGIVTAPETCDDTNAVNGDGCDNNCTVTACGNGIRTAGEACDDANLSNADDCLATCVLALCGDGVLRTGGTSPFEVCDDTNAVSGDGCDANCTPTACGNGIVTAGEVCDDGNLANGDGCDVNCTPTGCGNGVVSANEQCDDSNLIDGDGCDGNCTPTGCGNGVVTAGEACDDGNTRNDDACVVGCVQAQCGDGFRQRTVEECDDGCLAGVPNVCEPAIDDADEACSFQCQRLRPVRCGNGVTEAGEDCDDGNNSDNDACTNACGQAVCGDGIPHTKAGGTEECDDGNTAVGDGCNPQCIKECGNGVIDRFCSEPESSAGNACALDAECDSGPGVGDGRCIAGEECDPGSAGLCVDDHVLPVCSAACLVRFCGNAVVECDEECDLGADNGVSGSGCSLACTRNLAEAPAPRECPSAFTVDLPPQPLPLQRQTCVDGAACDFDLAVNGQCVFRIGVCLNRPQAGCTADGLQTFDLLGVKIRGRCSAGRVGAKCVVNEDCDSSAGAADGTCQLDRTVVATTVLTDGVVTLAEVGNAGVPGRCREGLKGKVCSVHEECDRAFGLGTGRCDVGTGVAFEPPLNATTLVGLANQVKICTDGLDIVVDAGSKLKLRSFVRRTTGRADKDHLMLVCEP